MGDCQYLIAEKDKMCFVKLIGKSDYMSCANFKQFVDESVEDKKYQEVFIDLTELEFIDSTNLGILAKFTDYMITTYNRKAVIYSTNKNINQIIRSVGFFDAFLVLETEVNKAVELRQINKSDKLSKEQLGEILLDAHKTLMELNETNKEIFSDVVKNLSKENK